MIQLTYDDLMLIIYRFSTEIYHEHKQEIDELLDVIGELRAENDRLKRGDS